MLGIDVAPLLTAYDERYADAPINPRRVFEAELATGANGSIRGTRGGPNWSVLVAAVMALVLAWSVARLIMDSPVELRGAAPILNGSAGVDNSAQQAADPVPVVLSAAGGGARVVVRDGTGKVVFTGNLAFGETKTLAGGAAGAGAVLRRVPRGRRSPARTRAPSAPPASRPRTPSPSADARRALRRSGDSYDVAAGGILETT